MTKLIISMHGRKDISGIANHIRLFNDGYESIELSSINLTDEECAVLCDAIISSPTGGSVRTISLSHNLLTDGAIDSLIKLVHPMLESLNISGNNFTNTELERLIKASKEMKYPRIIGHPRLEEGWSIDLSRLLLTDEACAARCDAIISSPTGGSVMTISLNGNLLTDGAIDSLIRLVQCLPMLKSLNISGNNFTNTELERLIKAIEKKKSPFDLSVKDREYEKITTNEDLLDLCTEDKKTIWRMAYAILNPGKLDLDHETTREFFVFSQKPDIEMLYQKIITDYGVSDQKTQINSMYDYIVHRCATCVLLEKKLDLNNLKIELEKKVETPECKVIIDKCLGQKEFQSDVASTLLVMIVTNFGCCFPGDEERATALAAALNKEQRVVAEFSWLYDIYDTYKEAQEVFKKCYKQYKLHQFWYHDPKRIESFFVNSNKKLQELEQFIDDKDLLISIKKTVCLNFLKTLLISENFDADLKRSFVNQMIESIKESEEIDEWELIIEAFQSAKEEMMGPVILVIAEVQIGQGLFRDDLADTMEKVLPGNALKTYFQLGDNLSTLIAETKPTQGLLILNNFFKHKRLPNEIQNLISEFIYGDENKSMEQFAITHFKRGIDGFLLGKNEEISKHGLYPAMLEQSGFKPNEMIELNPSEQWTKLMDHKANNYPGAVDLVVTAGEKVDFTAQLLLFLTCVDFMNYEIMRSTQLSEDTRTEEKNPAIEDRIAEFLDEGKNKAPSIQKRLMSAQEKQNNDSKKPPEEDASGGKKPGKM